MPCYKPLHGWWGHTRTPNGKRQVVFKREQAFTDQPVDIPCGQCIGCRIDKSQQWAIRCRDEARFHEFNSFVTLTYSPENMPADLSLNHRHFQLFMKRLRKKYTGHTIRFYMCGEYGDQNGRPHYHAILFGIDFPDKKRHSGTGDKTLYTSPELDKLWGLGYAVIGAVTEQSAGYCARYVFKKVTGDRAVDHYRRLDPLTGEVYWLTPEYARMSTNGGIGKPFYEKFASDLYPSDVSIVNGKPKPVPKYYDKQLEKENPELHQTIKRKRIARMSTKAAKANSTPQRLAVREECKAAKLKSFKRSL